MAQKIQGAQRDFSFGEIDVALKRADDHPARKAGLRQMSNCRILNSGGLQNRPGRSMLFPAPSANRIEEITMSPGHAFKLSFSDNALEVYNSAGSPAATFNLQGNGKPLPWTGANADQIVYAKLRLSIYFTFPGMHPQVLTWDGVSTWTMVDYAETVTSGGQKRTPFYRISPQGVTMIVGATSGNVQVKWSSPIVVAGMVGTRVRYAGRQILLTSVIDQFNMFGTVLEPLPPGQALSLSSSIGRFAPGDVVRGLLSGAEGIVITSPTSQNIQLVNLISVPNIGDTITGGTSGATGVVINVISGVIGVTLNTGTAFIAAETLTWASGTNTSFSVSAVTLTVQVISNGSTAPVFGAETVVGPSAQGVVSSAATTAPYAITVWDEEVFNDYRGWPASCFVDQFRLGFCNIPAVLNGIAWSAINAPNDLYVVGASLPSGGIFEVAPDPVQIYYVVAGPESSEFVFCDSKLYYIKIDASNPLRPGSVGFQTLSGDGCARVQPRITQEVMLYVNAGANSVMAIIAPGAYYRPFNTRNLCDFHSHLFSNIQAIAVPTADGTFNERYAYILNGDGSIVVGKYSLQDAQISPTIGWGPWSGAGDVNWVAATGANVIFTTTYFGSTACEILDDTQYLDGALFVNNLPAAMAPPAGLGPLWFYAGQTVSLMDQGTRSMGNYQVDANGNIVPQGNAGENLLAATLVAGQTWSGTIEPFAPDAQSGTDVGQRMKMRQITLFAAYVIHSTGFMMGGLFSGRQTRTSPALGTLMNERRFPAWNQDDDPTLPPPSRETVESHPPPGSTYDPRVVIIKDTPGPMMLVEIGIEVSI